MDVFERIILFDIDKTVFDTRASGKKYGQKLAERCHVGEEKIKESVESYRSQLESSTDFDPDELLARIETEYGVEKGNLEQVLFDQSNFILFPESGAVLEKLAKTSTLGLFSEGRQRWQKKKMELTGIARFFDPRYVIVERRKMNEESIKKIPQGSTVIDDKRVVIERLKQLRPDLNLIWINRENEEKIEGVTNIKSLKDLLE